MSRHKSGSQRAVSPPDWVLWGTSLWNLSLGMRDYGGFRLWSPKLYVRTLADGEIHGERWAQWSFIIQQMRGPKIVERFRILDSVLCATSKLCSLLSMALKTQRKRIKQQHLQARYICNQKPPKHRNNHYQKYSNVLVNETMLQCHDGKRFFTCIARFLVNMSLQSVVFPPKVF